MTLKGYAYNISAKICKKTLLASEKVYSSGMKVRLMFKFLFCFIFFIQMHYFPI